MSTVPIICSIKNLQIYSHVTGDNKFRNNFISFNESFSVSYDLYFYNSFQGSINTQENIILFEIPNEYLSNDSTLNSDYTHFFATEITSDSIDETITTSGDSIPRSSTLVSVENETILENNIRSISNTCKIVCDNNNNPIIYQYDLKTNTYVRTDTVYTNNSIDILSLHPFIFINGYLTNNSTVLYSNKKIYCDQCWDNINISILDTQSNDFTDTTILNSSLYMGELNIDNYFTYLRINGIDIQLENLKFDTSMGIYNYKNEFNLKLYIESQENINYVVSLTNLNLDSEILFTKNNDDSYNFPENSLQLIPANAVIVVKNANNEVIWISNILMFMDPISSSFSAYRYKTINDLGSIIKVISSSSDTILLQLQVILTPELGNIEIYSHPNAVFIEEEAKKLLNLDFSNLNITKATLIKRQIDHYVDDDDQKSYLITSNDAIFFTFKSFTKGNSPIEIETRTTSCPIISSNTCAFNIETTGVGVGMETTGTTQQRKFEVAANYTSHFYGPVEIFPVGAIYLSVTPDNPGKYFYGNWIAWGQGQIPIGVDPNVVDTNLNNLKEPNKIGGSAYHSITTKEMPPHYHRPANYSTVTKTENGVKYNSYFQTAISITSNATGRSTFTSGGKNHTIGSNKADWLRTVSRTGYAGGVGTTPAEAGTTKPMFIMPPYITCYMWRRES